MRKLKYSDAWKLMLIVGGLGYAGNRIQGVEDLLWIAAYIVLGSSFLFWLSEIYDSMKKATNERKTMKGKVQVTLLKRKHYDGLGEIVSLKTITISKNCPVCGGKRGTPKDHTDYDKDNQWYTYHTWTNPCGHVDSDEDLLKEAESIEATG